MLAILMQRERMRCNMHHCSPFFCMSHATTDPISMQSPDWRDRNDSEAVVALKDAISETEGQLTALGRLRRLQPDQFLRSVCAKIGAVVGWKAAPVAMPVQRLSGTGNMFK